MALATAFLSEDQFTCSICLDVFNNPVSTPCGHSFCQGCISSYWDSGGPRGAHRAFQCPLCKESYRKRPELQINRTLKEITEQFKQMAKGLPLDGGGRGGGGGGGGGGGEEYPSYPLLSAGSQRAGDMPGSVFAEMMSRFQQQQQQPSDTQPNVHNEPPPPYSPSRRYTLSGPGGTSSPAPNLPLCPIHLRGLEVFCRTDNTCICSTCVETEEHRGHSVTPAHREWHIKKSQLSISGVELKELILGKERKVEEIQNSLRQIQAAAEKETEGVVCVFTKLISSVERCQADILELIEMNRRAAEHHSQCVLKELEEEIKELQRRSATITQLALSEDYLHFLKVFPTISTTPQTKDWSGVSLESDLTSDGILRSVSLTLDRLQEELRVLPEGCQKPSVDKPVARPNPKIRRVQEYAADLTLDPHTAHPRLVISLDGKQVHCGDRHQSVVDNPERFDRVVCVLAREGFSSGRHYWEVEVGEKTDWDLGVASRSVNRKGKITVSPAHGYWFLSLRDHSDYAFRTEPSTILTVGVRPSRIGIYVDCDKGVLSFYNVDARVLIYTFTDSFPDTIHPFFSPCTNKSGKNEAPLVIRPLAPTK